MSHDAENNAEDIRNVLTPAQVLQVLMLNIFPRDRKNNNLLSVCFVLFARSQAPLMGKI